MSRICVIYHSGYGHTKAQADAVADGARSVPNTEVHQIPVQQIDANWEHCMAPMPSFWDPNLYGYGVG